MFGKCLQCTDDLQSLIIVLCLFYRNVENATYHYLPLSHSFVRLNEDNKIVHVSTLADKEAIVMRIKNDVFVTFSALRTRPSNCGKRLYVKLQESSKIFQTSAFLVDETVAQEFLIPLAVSVEEVCL